MLLFFFFSAASFTTIVNLNRVDVMLAVKRFGQVKKAPPHEDVSSEEEGGRKFKPQAVGAVKVLGMGLPGLGLGPSDNLKSVRDSDGSRSPATLSSRQKPIPPSRRSPLSNPSERLSHGDSDRGPSPKPPVRPKPDHKPPHENRDHKSYRSNSDSKINSVTKSSAPGKRPPPHPHKQKTTPPQPYSYTTTDKQRKKSLPVISQLQRITQNDNNRKISLPSPSKADKGLLGPATHGGKTKKLPLPPSQKSRPKEMEDTSEDFLMTNLDARCRSVSPLPFSARENGRPSQNKILLPLARTLSAESSDDGYEDMDDTDLPRAFSFGVPRTAVLPKLKTPVGGFKIHRQPLPTDRQVSNIYEEPSNFSLDSNSDGEYVYPEVIPQKRRGTSSSDDMIYANSPMENIYVNSTMDDNFTTYTSSPLSDGYYTREYSSSVPSFGGKLSSRSLPKKAFQSIGGGTSGFVDNVVRKSPTLRAGSDAAERRTNLLGGLSVSVPDLLVADTIDKTVESPPHKKSNDSLISELEKGGLTLDSPALHRISSFQNGPNQFVSEFCEESHKNKKVSFLKQTCTLYIYMSTLE